jgi:hypothetical protein
MPLARTPPFASPPTPLCVAIESGTYPIPLSPSVQNATERFLLATFAASDEIRPPGAHFSSSSLPSTICPSRVTGAPPLTTDFGRKCHLPPSSGESLPHPLLQIISFPHLLSLASCCRNRPGHWRPPLPRHHPRTPPPGMDSAPRRGLDALVSPLYVALPNDLPSPRRCSPRWHLRPGATGERARGRATMSARCGVTGQGVPTHCALGMGLVGCFWLWAEPTVCALGPL